MCAYFCSDPRYPVCPLVEAGYPTEGHWRKALAEREVTERLKATPQVECKTEPSPALIDARVRWYGGTGYLP